MTSTYTKQDITSAVAAALAPFGSFKDLGASVAGQGDVFAVASEQAASLREQAASVEMQGASMLQRQAVYCAAARYGDPADRLTFPVLASALGVTKSKAERWARVGVAFHVEIPTEQVPTLTNDVTTARNLGANDERLMPALLSDDPVAAVAALRATLEAERDAIIPDPDDNDDDNNDPGDVTPPVDPEETLLDEVARHLQAIAGPLGKVAAALKIADADDRVAIVAMIGEALTPAHDAIRASGVTVEQVTAFRAARDTEQADTEQDTEQADDTATVNA